MAVMAQNRFRTAARRQDSFHYEGRRPSGNPATSNGNGVLSVPATDQQPRRHSTGHINIAALQPNLENLKLQQEVSVHRDKYFKRYLYELRPSAFKYVLTSKKKH